MAKVEQIPFHEMPRDAQIAIKEYAKESAAKKSELDARLKNNAEYQRNQTMSKEAKGRRAIDLMTKSQKEYLSHKEGREVSHTEAEAAARKIAKQVHRQDY